MAMVIIFACLATGMVSLTLYYLDIYKHWSVRWFSTLHLGFTVIAGLVSTCYLVNVSFWVLLGVTLDPDKVLPIAAIVIVLFFVAYTSIQNVINLHNLLEKELKDHYAKQVISLSRANSGLRSSPTFPRGPSAPSTNEPPTPSASNNAPAPVESVNIDVKHLSLGDLLTIVKKSKVLELAGLSIWERIWTEVFMFVILLGTLSFLALGFWVLSTNSQFVSSITTIIVFIIGGGISIPIRVNSTQDHDNFVEKVRSHAASQMKKDN